MPDCLTTLMTGGNDLVSLKNMYCAGAPTPLKGGLVRKVWGWLGVLIVAALGWVN
jgi:hypothetical protein